MVDLGRLAEKYTAVAPHGTTPQGCPVFRAVHAHLGCPVLIRVLPCLSAEGSGQQQELFRRGAKAAAGLRHQNILQVLDYETTPEANLLITEFAEGESLDALLKRQGPLPPDQVFPIAWQLSEALELAHAAGRIHRNLRPSEILLTPRGQVKLGGFEAATLPDDPDDRFSGDPYLGNVFFMSPEQAQGQPVTPLSDVYALGVLLYLMLTGRPPVTGARSWAVLYRKCAADPPPPSQVRPGLSAEIDALVLKLLRRAPADRFPTMADFRRAFARVAEPPPAAGGGAEEVVAKRYPFPIAISYALVWQELEWATRLSRLLYLFEATLKYSAALALLAGPAPAGGDEPPTLRRPSLGHWAGYLRAALKAPAPSRLLEELARCYHGRTALSCRGLDIIDYGVQLRNRFMHGAALQEAVYRQAFEELLPRVQALLQGLAFLPGFPLAKVLRLQFTGEGFVVVYRSYMGALPVFPTAEVVLPRPLQDGKFGVLDPGAGDFLDLMPLLRAAECRICGDEEVFFYNGMRSKGRFDFLSYQKGHAVEEELSGDPFAERGLRV